MKKKLFSIGLGLLMVGETSVSLALPPPEDIPEEVLRNEIIIEARSHLNNQALSVEKYVLLRQELAQSPYPPQLNSKIRHLIFLLQVRKFLTTVTPL